MWRTLRRRLVGWFKPVAEEARCPVCGRVVIARRPNRIDSPLAGSWTLPRSRQELIGYCEEQLGTEHRSDTGV